MTDAEYRAKLRAAIDLLLDLQSVHRTPSLSPVGNDPPRVPDALLDPESTAARLKLSVTSVYRLARTGKLPGVKLGASWRFRLAAVEAFVEAQARGPSPDATDRDSLTR